MNIKNLKIKEGYILRELGGEFCLALEGDTNNGAVYGLPSLNETCIFLWEHLENGETHKELVQSLVSRRGYDYDDAYEDVNEFLAKLINGNIVEYESE